MVTIISDKPLIPVDYVEALTGRYFPNCDTFSEVKDRLNSVHITCGNGIRFSEMPFVLRAAYGDADDHIYVPVEFSTEEDYTKHIIKFMYIPKKYISRVKRYIENSDEY